MNAWQRHEKAARQLSNDQKATNAAKKLSGNGDNAAIDWIV
jgi:hypothetical protein